MGAEEAGPSVCRWDGRNPPMGSNSAQAHLHSCPSRCPRARQPPQASACLSSGDVWCWGAHGGALLGPPEQHMCTCEQPPGPTLNSGAWQALVPALRSSAREGPWQSGGLSMTLGVGSVCRRHRGKTGGWAPCLGYSPALSQVEEEWQVSPTSAPGWWWCLLGLGPKHTPGRTQAE